MRPKNRRRPFLSRSKLMVRRAPSRIQPRTLRRVEHAPQQPTDATLSVSHQLLFYTSRYTPRVLCSYARAPTMRAYTCNDVGVEIRTNFDKDADIVSISSPSSAMTTGGEKTSQRFPNVVEWLRFYRRGNGVKFARGWVICVICAREKKRIERRGSK